MWTPWHDFERFFFDNFGTIYDEIEPHPHIFDLAPLMSWKFMVHIYQKLTSETTLGLNFRQSNYEIPFFLQVLLVFLEILFACSSNFAQITCVKNWNHKIHCAKMPKLHFSTIGWLETRANHFEVSSIGGASVCYCFSWVCEKWTLAQNCFNIRNAHAILSILMCHIDIFGGKMRTSAS